MKNERIVLTPGLCRDLKSKDKQYFVYDLNCPGLWLRIVSSCLVLLFCNNYCKITKHLIHIDSCINNFYKN